MSAQKLGFALEYSLGHTTHAQNLKRVLAEDETLRASITPTFVDLPFNGSGAWWEKLPAVRSNWSIRASLGAYLGLRRSASRGQLEAILFHTQVTSLFSTGIMRRVPSVISLDATPLQYDALGAFYGHAPSGNSRLEALKKRMNERAFAAARHLVTWSEWTKGSLVRDYGVPADKIMVIPPGIDTAAWNFTSRRQAGPDNAINVLFVGGDFSRKGGETLTSAWRALPESLRNQAHLHIVTKTPGVADGLPNATAYTNITPNSKELIDLFAAADMFVFPTRGDCLPLAVLEALASGLPVITTDVGALSEAVRDGQTGLVVPPDDIPALTAAITRLLEDRAYRRTLGVSARESALARFDAAQNYRALVNVVTNSAHRVSEG